MSGMSGETILFLMSIVMGLSILVVIVIPLVIALFKKEIINE